MALISRFPDWLYDGLRLAEPKIPLQLGEDSVFPVLDIAQGGRGFAVFDPVEIIQPASTAAQDRVIIPGNDASFQLIWFLAFLNSRAAAGTITLFLRDTEGTGRTIFYGTLSAGAGAIADSVSIGLLGFRPLFIPPRWEFVGGFDLTGVAESQVVTLVVERIPRGFNANV